MDFEWDQYEALEELLGKIKGKMLISLGDHPATRKLFSAHEIQEIPYHYTVGGKRTKTTELLIANYPLQPV